MWRRRHNCILLDMERRRGQGRHHRRSSSQAPSSCRRQHLLPKQRITPPCHHLDRASLQFTSRDEQTTELEPQRHKRRPAGTGEGARWWLSYPLLLIKDSWSWTSPRCIGYPTRVASDSSNSDIYCLPNPIQIFGSTGFQQNSWTFMSLFRICSESGNYSFAPPYPVIQHTNCKIIFLRKTLCLYP